jgi:hypothetical protein
MEYIRNGVPQDGTKKGQRSAKCDHRMPKAEFQRILSGGPIGRQHSILHVNPAQSGRVSLNFKQRTKIIRLFLFLFKITSC